MRFIDFYQLPEVQLVLERIDYGSWGISSRLYKVLEVFLKTNESCSNWELESHYYISDVRDLYLAEKSIKRGNYHAHVTLYRHCIEEVEEYFRGKYPSYSLKVETRNYKKLEDSHVVTLCLLKTLDSEL